MEDDFPWFLLMYPPEEYLEEEEEKPAIEPIVRHTPKLRNMPQKPVFKSRFKKPVFVPFRRK